MTNKVLKNALLKKLNVTRQRLSQRVQAVIRQIPMNTKDATYCIAHKAGLRLDKFLDDETVSHVRELVCRLQPGSEFERRENGATKIATKIKEIQVGHSLSIADPIL